MAWFGRAKKSKVSETGPTDSEAVVESPTTSGHSAPSAGSTTPESDPARGPWDVSAVTDRDGYLQLGSLWVPALEGLMFTFEMDQSQSQVTAVQVVRGDSTMQVQAFAAPRSSGLWDEIRAEIAGGVRERGATVTEQEGDLGTELFVEVDGSAMRFIGVDGPRWFLRGVLSGAAAADEQAAAPLREVFERIVVDRGQEPMGPRELLSLALPAETGSAGDEPAGRRASDLDPFTRGPEITEIR